MVRKIKKRKQWRPSDRAATALEAKSKELHRLIDSLDETDALPIDVPDINLSSDEVTFGMTQNLFRRAYHGLRGEPMEVQQDLLSRMKAAAVGLMACDRQFRSTADVSDPSIKTNTDVLYHYVQQKGMWDADGVEKTLRSPSMLNSTDLRAKRLATYMAGTELLDLWNDMERQHEAIKEDYRQRLSPLLHANPVRNPLVVGVMTYGLYFAAMFYRAVQENGQHPDLAVVKKSRQDRQVHVFPTEEGMIRDAISSGRDIVVVDDLIHDFKGFFAIYDHFGKPPTIRFSAGFYTSPLPVEFNIMERCLFEYLLKKPEKISFADNLAQRSLMSILQYGNGINRVERRVLVLPPVI